MAGDARDLPGQFTWVTYFDEPITHGTMFRRAFEEGLLIEDRSMHVGIRGPVYDQDDFVRDHEFGFQIIRCSDIDDIGVPEAVRRVQERIGDTPVYLSIDIDVLDPAFAPGTGTPEMGGLHSRELLRMLRALKGINIVGADVVEVSPAYDHADTTALAAATVVFDIMGLLTNSWFRRKGIGGAACQVELAWQAAPLVCSRRATPR